MCGIAGVIGKHAVRRVRAMLPLMAHRGPDGEGVWSGNPCLALGHRRLAINDLSETGRQPMISPDGATVIVVNGEIYNYPDLRKELETLGAIFNSTSDSEIVLHAWRQWGIECFARFNGMFAIGLFDDTKNLLVLARDRLGIKPLYYRLGTQELVFASEIKGLLAGLEFTPDLDPVGLNQYLLYQNCFGDRSLREGVRLLRPGHILSCTPEGVSELRPFWSLKFGDSSVACDFETAVDRYRETLDAAVHRHLMSDVPVASYLSAGFDSATVATRASAYGSPPVCFTGCFSEGGWYDETTTAAAMAAHNGSRHIKVSIEPTDMPRVMDSLLAALDEPRMGMGAFPQYCVAEKVAETHKVILTGHGGDELFSGYPVFKLVEISALLTKAPTQAYSHLLKMNFPEWSHLVYFLLSTLRASVYRQYLPVLNSPSSLQMGLRSHWAEAIRELRGEDELLALNGSCENQSQVLYSHYLQAYLNGLLVVEDKLSMAHSLESRTPLLDNAMLDLSLALPQSVKLHRGELKAIIKAGGRGWLPDALYQQPKRGFPTPLRHWLRGHLRNWFEQRLTGPDSGLRKLFKDDWLSQTCTRYLNSPWRKVRPLDEIQSHRMWQLLSLESWLRQMG